MDFLEFVTGLIIGGLLVGMYFASKKTTKKPLTEAFLLSYYSAEEVDEVLTKMLDRRLEQEENKRLAKEASDLEKGLN